VAVVSSYEASFALLARGKSIQLCAPELDQCKVDIVKADLLTMRPPTDGQLKCRYVLAVIGVLVGLSVAIIFAIVFHNPDTAAWGLASGKLSITLHCISSQQIC